MNPYERGYGDVSRVAEQRIALRGGYNVTEDLHQLRRMSTDLKYPVGDAKDAPLVDGLPVFVSSLMPSAPDHTLAPITTSMAGWGRREKLRVAGVCNQTGDGTSANLASYAITGSLVPAKKTTKCAFYDGDVIMAGPPLTFEGPDGRQHSYGYCNGRDGIPDKYVGPSMYVLRHGDATARFDEMDKRITQLVRDTLRTKMGNQPGDWTFVPGVGGGNRGLDGSTLSYLCPDAVPAGCLQFVIPAASRANDDPANTVVNFGNGGQPSLMARTVMTRFFRPPQAVAVGVQRRTAFLDAVAKIAHEFDPIEAGYWNPMTRIAFLIAASWGCVNYLWGALPSDGDPPIGVPMIENPQIQLAIRAAWDHSVADAIVAPYVSDQLQRRAQLDKMAYYNPIDTGMFAPMLMALMDEERHRIKSMAIGTNIGFSAAEKTEWDCLVGVH